MEPMHPLIVITAFAYVEQLNFPGDESTVIYQVPGTSFVISSVHIPRQSYRFEDHVVFTIAGIDVPLVLNTFMFRVSPCQSALTYQLDPAVLITGGLTVHRNFTGKLPFCLCGRLYR